MHKRTSWSDLGVWLIVLAAFVTACSKRSEDQFTQLMTRGNGFFESGDATNAIAAYLRATAIGPDSIDARLNLANAYLLAGDASNAVEQCRQILQLDHNNAAAYYVMGCAHLRLNQGESAVQALQQSKQIDPAVTALNFQLGLAHERLGHLEEARAEFETVVRFEPNHPSVHYQLSRLYQRLNQNADAASELEKHQQLQAKGQAVPPGPGAFERCKYTMPRVAFALEQPAARGIPVHFVEATASAFGSLTNFHGPVAVLDYGHDGRNSLFVIEDKSGFRLLANTGGRFETIGEPVPGKSGASYRRVLVGDLNNDRSEEVLVLGEQGCHVLNAATNGRLREVTAMTGLRGVPARDGLLADLDFTGKLDFLAVLPEGQGIKLYRNLGNSFFKEEPGLPAGLAGVEHVAVEDWNNEDVPGVFVSQTGKPPVFFSKQRAGSLVATNVGKFPLGNLLATGDLDNDLRPDLILAGDQKLEIVFGGAKTNVNLRLQGFTAAGLLLVDYDNDGWLDLIAYGNGVRAWRNQGIAGFADVTASLGLEKIGQIDCVVAADFDADGDTDLVLSGAGGLQFWRNDGGNANHQLKLRLAGNRSNASALGVRVEVIAGNWRAIRTLQQTPLEIGTGKHEKIDVLKVRWFDLATTLVDVPWQAKPLLLDELTLPTGSCPYLYAWDGAGFRFVTDILGASPLGLPVSKERYIEADPEELLSLGSDQEFLPRDGSYEIRITEELREVLYLDEASLITVDHPASTLILPTSKLRPGKPFPPHQLWTLRPVAALNQATRSDGLDVTDALRRTDRRLVSPVRLREPQLRGLAEPFSIVMDFGEIPDSAIVLALNGWLRFGGGMANIAASLDTNLPFPFPVLEAQLPDGSWKKLEIDVGAPCGKTKTILVDLENQLPPGTRRLRLTTAFEIHWDSASLCEKVPSNQNVQRVLSPQRADLHWRGFSDFMNLPAFLPLTPDYEKVHPVPPWLRTPSGWCTRYGPVNELLERSDDVLALLNGGDELSLTFAADQLPPKPDGFVRDFFLHVVGWDKDADFHVGQGWRVEPLPYRGMDDQGYARLDQSAQPPGTERARKYNTRWVGPQVLSRK